LARHIGKLYYAHSMLKPTIMLNNSLSSFRVCKTELQNYFCFERNQYSKKTHFLPTSSKIMRPEKLLWLICVPSL